MEFTTYVPDLQSKKRKKSIEDRNSNYSAFCGDEWGSGEIGDKRSKTDLKRYFRYKI